MEPVSQPFVKQNYQERHSEIKEYVIYKWCKKEVFIYKESIVYLFVEMIPKHNVKDDLFYLSKDQQVEILNDMQFTLMSALFWTFEVEILNYVQFTLMSALFWTSD